MIPVYRDWESYTNVTVCVFDNREGYFIRNLDDDILLENPVFDSLHDAVQYSFSHLWIMHTIWI